MRTKNGERYLEQESGYMLVAVLFVLTLSIMVTTGLMSSASSHSKIRATVDTQSDSYYEVEQTLGKVVGWMQDNSKYLVTPFNSTNFNTNFDMGSPVLGDNEGVNFAVPTMVKMKGTSDSVMLSNNDFFGESAFPATTHIDTSASFDAIEEFENADFGNANARVILVWARLTDGNYEPIFRVDVITGNNPDRGVHSYSYIYTNLVTAPIVSPFLGFYGEDSLSTNTSNNQCNSYKYTYASGAWSRGAVRSNCSIYSSSNMTIRSRISGNALTNVSSGISLSGSGLISGTSCQTSGCHTVVPTSLNTWATDCATNQGDLTISSNTVLTPAGSAPSQNCWQDITVNSGRTLTFNSTTYPYHIRTLRLIGTGRIAFPTIASGSQVALYIDRIFGDSINGNSFYNNNNSPQVVKMYYTGNNALTLNGTAEFNVCIDAPSANINLNGNFIYYGGIKAQNLSATGSAIFNTDEDGCGGTTTTTALSDIGFSLRKASQRYRLYS